MAEASLKLGGDWATKEGSLLAYNDQNGNYKPLPFDFTRASTATRVNRDGLIEEVQSGVPRIDFLDNADGALLLEPQRTNSISNTDLNQWTKSGSVTLTPTISPSGDNDAYLFSGTGNVNIGTSIPSAGNYIFSIYAKGNIGDSFRVLKSNGFSYAQNLITLDTTEWKRYFFSRSFTSTSGIIFIDSFADDNISLYAPQLEEGSYATSLIKTSGSAVTRLADNTVNENLNVDYSSDYTLYTEFETLSLTEYNQFQFRQETPSISYILRIGNQINVGAGIYTTNNTIGFNKFALSITSSGSYKFYKNAVLLSSGSGLNANLQTLKNDAAGMNVKEVKLYNTALTDTELQELTTI